LGGRDCDIAVDVMRYRSPLYYVRKNDGRQFDVATSLATTQATGDLVGDVMGKLLGKLAGVVGVPAAVAKPILDGVNDNIIKATLTNNQKFILHFPIGDDVVATPMSWTIPGALLGKAGEGKGDIVIAAQLVPVPPLVAAPADGAWTYGKVLGSAFQLPATPGVPSDDTLGGYLSARFHADEQAYSTAGSADAANGACVQLGRSIDGTGLSDRDAALALWAMTRQRITLGKAKVGEVDAMPCLESRWPTLLLAGVQKGEPPPPDAVRPTNDQMEATIDHHEALLTFFKAIDWKFRKEAAEELFSYPLQVTDAGNALVPDGPVTVDNTNGWLVSINKDKPLLEHLGCYAFFDAKATEDFAIARNRSFMLAIGEVAGTAREIALLADFAASPGGASPRIDALGVLPELTDDMKAGMKKRVGANACRSGYAPALLFGH
jgi:hypothetical protein